LPNELQLSSLPGIRAAGDRLNLRSVDLGHFLPSPEEKPNPQQADQRVMKPSYIIGRATTAVVSFDGENRVFDARNVWLRVIESRSDRLPTVI
jgi:hypothetical protein